MTGITLETAIRRAKGIFLRETPSQKRLNKINKKVVKSTKDFNKFLREVSKEVLPEQHNEFIRIIVLDVLTRVVLKTPVDKGRARGNWQVTLNSPATGEVNKEAAGQEAEASSLSSSGASEIVSEAMRKLNNLGFGEIVWISNNLDYILFLEDGHSSQAPNGMLAVSLAEVQAQFS